MSDFMKNPRKQSELRRRPAIDAIYNRVFPGCTIKRFDHGNDLILDVRFAIDVELKMPNGMILLGQEKALGNEFARFRSVTVEYYQDPTIKEEGDWFKLAAQFLFCGYANITDTEFNPWVILDWAQVVESTRLNNIHWMINKNKDGRARANFKYTVMDKLPVSCILHSGGLAVPILMPKPVVKPRQMTLEPKLRQPSLFEAVPQASEKKSSVTP